MGFLNDTGPFQTVLALAGLAGVLAGFGSLLGINLLRNSNKDLKIAQDSLRERMQETEARNTILEHDNESLRNEVRTLSNVVTAKDDIHGLAVEMRGMHAETLEAVVQTNDKITETNEKLVEMLRRK